MAKKPKKPKKDDKKEIFAELRKEVRALKAQIAKFDHDADGNVGGSRKRKSA